MTAQQNQEYLRRLRELSGMVNAAQRAEALRQAQETKDIQSAKAANHRPASAASAPSAHAANAKSSVPAQHQTRINAEIFKAVEVLGRKLERSQGEQERLQRRVNYLESSAAFDEQTGRYYLPVLADQAQAPVPPAGARWPMFVSVFSAVVALSAIGLVMMREPSLTPSQVAGLQLQRPFTTLDTTSPAWRTVPMQAPASDTAARPDPELDEMLGTLAARRQQQDEQQAMMSVTDDAALQTAQEDELPDDLPELAANTANSGIIADESAADVQLAETDVSVVGEAAVQDSVDIASVVPPAPAAAKPRTPAATAAVAEKAKPAPKRDAIEAPGVAADMNPDARLRFDTVDLERRAFQGLAEAQHDLATLYAAGRGAPQDYQRAAYWFRRAAESGIANAHYNLGVMYHQGLGIPADLKRAVSWYKNAAELGHPEAMYNLGISYVQGVGVAADTKRGIDYLERAADGGISQAAYNIGILHESNFIGPINKTEAARWYKRAADMGNTEARDAYTRLASAKRSNLESDESLGQGDVTGAGDTISLAPAAGKSAATTATGPSTLVSRVQQALIAKNYLPGTASGYMDQRTEDAIRAYQQKNGLKVDGQPSGGLLKALQQ